MGEITPYQKKVSTIREFLERSKPQMLMALPKHMNADRMLRVAMTSIQRTPRLVDCSPTSLVGAVIQSSQLGLEPDGVLGHAYLVPYKDRATLIPGYKGLIDLARRSGGIGRIYARIVYEKDTFEIEYGLNEKLRHIPSSEEDPGGILGAYAIAWLRDGTPQTEWMWKREIDAIRKRSRASNEGPWCTDYQEMAKKTVLRRLCKMLPASVELHTAVALDELAEAGIPQDLELLAPETVTVEPEPDKSKLDALTEQLINGDKPQEKPPPTKKAKSPKEPPALTPAEREEAQIRESLDSLKEKGKAKGWCDIEENVNAFIGVYCKHKTQEALSLGELTTLHRIMDATASSSSEEPDDHKGE